MGISTSDIERLAELSKLQFSESELEDMKSDMDKILGFVDKLNELDTDNVEPLLFMTDEVNVLRPDESETSVTQKEALKNAPRKDSDYVKIPKVLKNS